MLGSLVGGDGRTEVDDAEGAEISLNVEFECGGTGGDTNVGGCLLEAGD